MAHATANTSAHAGHTFRITRMISDLKTRIERYRRFRATLAEMQELTDRELADFGLSRSMLRRAAYEAAYG